AVLLPVVNYLGRVLMGDEDLASDEKGSAFIDATLANFPPGFRRDISLRRAGLTTSDGESHLFTSGEFVAYYLLTWSPALWSLELWQPDFDPAAIRAPEEWIVSFLYVDPDKDPNDRELSDDYKDLQAALPIADSPPKAAPTDVERRAQAQWYFQQKVRWTA